MVTSGQNCISMLRYVCNSKVYTQAYNTAYTCGSENIYATKPKTVFKLSPVQCALNGNASELDAVR